MRYYTPEPTTEVLITPFAGGRFHVCTRIVGGSGFVRDWGFYSASALRWMLEQSPADTRVSLFNVPFAYKGAS